MEYPPITLSIVTYNTEPDIFSACLESVIQIQIPFVCFCVDNSQDSEIEERVRQAVYRVPAGSRIEYIPNLNSGYGRAHNIAIERMLTQQESRYHLVMNPDVSFGPGVVEVMVEWMERHPDVGLASPKIVYPDGRLQRLCKLLPTPGHLFARRFLPFWAKKNDALYQLECANYEAVFECPSLSGCFMLLRAAALRQVGTFDERFFMYFEDVDLARRIGRQYRTVYCPLAAIIHHYKKESYSNRRLLLNHVTSAVKYFNKWGWFFDDRRNAINRKTILQIEEQMKSRDACRSSPSI